MFRNSPGISLSESDLARRLTAILGLHRRPRPQKAIAGDLDRTLADQRPKSRLTSLSDLHRTEVSGSTRLCGVQDGKGITSQVPSVTR